MITLAIEYQMWCSDDCGLGGRSERLGVWSENERRAPRGKAAKIIRACDCRGSVREACEPITYRDFAFAVISTRHIVTTGAGVP